MRELSCAERTIQKRCNHLLEAVRFLSAKDIWKMRRNWSESLAGDDAFLGPEDRRALETMNELAMVLEDEGYFNEAEKLEREAIEVASRTQGPERSYQVLASMGQLGLSLYG